MTRSVVMLEPMDSMVAARLANQCIGGSKLAPAQIVAALGAMQAQDFAGAKWAVGLRASGATDADVQGAFDRGEFLRTHPMRGTHHWVAPADIRWLLTLLAPRTHMLCKGRHRNLGLDATTLDRAMRALERALAGGNDLTRAETAAVLQRAGVSQGQRIVSPEGQWLAHIVMHAEVIGLVCSGPRRGKQITIALLDERVPHGDSLDRDDAVVELARRYFTTRGPATVKDFVWWSSLTTVDARSGIEGAQLAREDIDGVEHWRGEQREPVTGPRAHLLPPYDEYTVAYQQRGAAGKAPARIRGAMEQWLLAPNVVVDGRVAGTWKRSVHKERLAVAVTPWRRLARDEQAAIDEASARYAEFVGLELVSERYRLSSVAS